MSQIDKKRIARNTVYMYIRLFIVMAVTIYTARVILDKLGAEDYGIYTAVAGVVGMLSFLNNTLAKGTSRFLTYELGRDDKQRISDTFSTSFISHLVLAIGVVLLLEGIGSWFISHKLLIPEARMQAALWLFQISLIPMFLGIVMVPYTASIIAHEDMNVYAYLGLFEAGAKLVIVYLLSMTTFDKLIFYAFLLAIVQLILFIFYVVFCWEKYKESRRVKVFDINIFKSMLGFSGWNLITHLGMMLKQQGTNILLGMFFRPVVIAAQAIANQMTNALMNFVYNFTTAINPQIIKSYATGDYEGSKKLTLESTVFVFDLVLLICLPFFFTIETILNLWLVEVPEYTVIFCRFILFAQILDVFNVTLYTPMLASGKLKTNSVVSGVYSILRIIILYLLFKMGVSVMWLQYELVASTIMWSFFLKPFILCREIDYCKKDLAKCYISCSKVLLPSILLSFLLYRVIGGMLWQQIMLFFGVALIVLFFSFIFMEVTIRKRIVNLVISKFRR